MSSTVELLRAKLAADATVAGLVGTKIFPAVAPQGTVPPFIVCLEVSDVPENTLTGDASSTLRGVRVQIDCYAKSYSDAQAVADAVDAVVAALSTPQLSAWRELSRDLYDTEAKLHRVSMDVMVWR